MLPYIPKVKLLQSMRKRKTVTVHGEQVSYDSLVLAAGAEPVVPPVPGTELNGVFTVRVPEDAINMRKLCRKLQKRQL